jgi:hypothetical protein
MVRSQDGRCRSEQKQRRPFGQDRSNLIGRGAEHDFQIRENNLIDDRFLDSEQSGESKVAE